MGFRDLEILNLALLAKQIWRVITSPNLLVSKVLKAKYMKEGNWIETQPPPTASWCWKSIHKGGELLQQGLWKRVGDGRTVRIWEDKWIPGSTNGCVSTPRPTSCPLVYVHELIEDGRWKSDLLQLWFRSEDITLISSIPLSIFGRKDRFYWQYSQSGSYTVKTGYAVAKGTVANMRSKTAHEPETSWEIRKHTVWKRLWSLNIKLKLKHFLWRCLQNALPANETLFKRIGKGSNICSCCGDNAETIEHMLFFCPTAKVVWKLAPVKWDGIAELQGNFWNWWVAVMQSAKEAHGLDRIQLTVSILWQVWKARNKMTFQAERGNAKLIVDKAHSEWLEYEACNETNGRPATTAEENGQSQ